MVIYTERYALGADPLAYYSKSKIKKTVDNGLSWTDVAAPFPVHRQLISAASGYVSPNTHVIALSNGGDGAISVITPTSGSNDPVDWTTYAFENPSWQLNKVINTSSSSPFLAVGYEKNLTTRAEMAVIVYTDTGYDSSTWERRWISTDTYSGLFDVSAMDYSNYFAVGYVNSFGSPLLLWSSDTLTWNPIPLPSAITGPLYSVVTDGFNSIIRIGGNGFVATATWQGPNTRDWVVNNRLLRNGKPKAITTLVNTFGFLSGPVTGMALSGDTIFWSQNEYDYTSITVPGYNFKSAYWDGTKWYFGCTSRLNQYTGFFGTFTNEANPTLQLTGFNSGVHTYAWLG